MITNITIEAGRLLSKYYNYVHFTQMRLLQEVELKAAAADREISLLRTSLHQEKEQVQQLHELLALKEQEHRYMKNALEKYSHLIIDRAGFAPNIKGQSLSVKSEKISSRKIL